MLPGTQALQGLRKGSSILRHVTFHQALAPALLHSSTVIYASAFFHVQTDSRLTGLQTQKCGPFYPLHYIPMNIFLYSFFLIRVSTENVILFLVFTLSLYKV
jgi:hypothetical protein